MWYVNFLKLGNADLPVGSTNDLRRRLASDQRGQVTSTKAHLPVILNAYIAVQTEQKVPEFEKYFKSGSGKAFANKRFLS